MFHMWKLIKCWFKSKLKGGSSVGRTNMHSVLTHTHTHIHTHNPFCAPHTQKKKQFLKNSTFSTILDVTRHFGLDTRVWVNHILLSSHLCACLVISVFSLFRCLLLHREHFFFFFFYWTLGDIKKHRGDWPPTENWANMSEAVMLASTVHQRYTR